MLSDITIFLKSFLRHGLLSDCLEGIRQNFSECPVLVIDDSDQELKFEASSKLCTTLIHLPFDSGFGAKSNEMIRHVKTKYVLIGSDDFDFRSVRTGVEMLYATLENGNFAVASGRVGHRPYEAIFEFGPGFCKERTGHYPIELVNGFAVWPCDLTVNFSLIKTEILGWGENQVHWDDDVKIGGGEHGAFFIDLYRAKHRVCYVPGVNIHELPYDPKKVDPRYKAFRARALQPGRICLKRRGIDRYFYAGHWEEA